MKLSTKERDDGYYFDLFKKKRIMISKSIHVITALTIALFVLGGYGLDAVFGTAPIFLILLLVISFPVTQLLVLRHVRKKVLPLQ